MSVSFFVDDGKLISEVRIKCKHNATVEQIWKVISFFESGERLIFTGLNFAKSNINKQ